MSQLGKSNLNLNLNLNLASAAGLAAGGGTGCRINTQEFRKLVDSAAPLAPNGATAFGVVDPREVKRIKYREFWDADLQACVYLDEFLDKNKGWLTTIRKKLEPIEEKLRQTLNDQFEEMVNHIPERESRFAEILQQNSAEGCLSYWLGMLLIDSSTPATHLLVRVARRIGEHVVMCLKQEFQFPRPSQLCPAIVPMIDPPLHPSFPSGHALQSRLISNCLKDARADLPQAAVLLDELAERVALNRVIAGIHYPKDNEAGVVAAEACYQMLKKGEKFGKLLDRAKAEALRRPAAGSGDPVIARRLEIRAAPEQNLEKLEIELSNLAGSLGVKVPDRARREHVRRLDVKIVGPAMKVAEVVEAVKGLGAQVMRDEVLPAPGAPPDPLYPDPESGRRIAVPGSAGTPGYPSVLVPGDPVIVAIIDSGIMATHPKLRAHLWSDPGFGVLRSDIEDSDIEDADGHGTMLAGTVLAGANQSPAVRLMAVKFFDARTIPDSRRAARAIDGAVRRGAHILNLSWAVGIDRQLAIRDAIKAAGDVLVVVAAGNSGADNDKCPTVPASYGGDLPNVITVMATDDLDDQPGFSNYGKTSVHIAAPGMRVVSTHPYRSVAAPPSDLVSYQRYDGTSSAAAYVAGTAALLKSQDPTMSPERIRSILISTADRRSDLRCVAGGRLNVSRALARVNAPGGVTSRTF